METPFDPKEIGLKVGLEIHQQLATSEKLFCACPIAKSEELPYSFERRLRPAQSELGRLDPAAVFEFAKGRVNVYRWSPESSCLVEADEEPPHPVAREAVDISVLIAELLHSNVVDELHVMRKIVIDGSNTGGFQRTTIVALGGFLEVEGEKVGVQTVTLEEDASRILGEDDNARYFALDRLGVPLVEIALDPVSGTPEKVERVALNLGRALRSTGRVARGLGTIRQDLNVSIMGGRVVEVKGVQKLNLIEKVVSYEVRRQTGLVRISEEMATRGLTGVRHESKDVSKALETASSRVIQKQLKEGGKVVCVTARGLGGLLGWEPFPGVRLGKELAEVARANSLGGIIHSDEFAKQGFSQMEEASLRRELGADEHDALVLVAGEPSKVDATVPLIIARLEAALDGVPAETRAATVSGETRYMRPRPGAQRMYPETDIPEIVIDEERKDAIRKLVPVPWQAEVKRLEKEYSLSHDLALRLYDSELRETFKELAGSLRLEPSVIASVLVELPVRLAREGVPEGQVELWIPAVLAAVDAGKVAKEAAPDILRLLGTGKALSFQDAIQKLGLEMLSEHDLKSLIDRVVAESKFVHSDGDAAFSALMGQVMKQARGRADGSVVSKLLKERLASSKA